MYKYIPGTKQVDVDFDQLPGQISDQSKPERKPKTEVLDGKYNEKCDVWSIGVIMYHLCLVHGRVRGNCGKFQMIFGSWSASQKRGPCVQMPVHL